MGHSSTGNHLLHRRYAVLFINNHLNQMTTQCTVCETKHGSLRPVKVFNLNGVNICPECALSGFLGRLVDQYEVDKAADKAAVISILETAAKTIETVRRDYETKLGEKHGKN